MECEQIWSRQTHKSTIRGDHKQPSQKAAIEIALENLRILTAMVAQFVVKGRALFRHHINKRFKQRWSKNNLQ